VCGIADLGIFKTKTTRKIEVVVYYFEAFFCRVSDDLSEKPSFTKDCHDRPKVDGWCILAPRKLNFIQMECGVWCMSYSVRFL
jgi:hypothetical protein